MAASLGRLSGEEAQALKNWLRVRDPHRSPEKAQVLDEIDAALEKAHRTESKARQES